MSLEQLKAFLEKVKGNPILQDKLKKAMSTDDVVTIAKEHGHEFSTDHLSELSDQELEGVTGGLYSVAPCVPGQTKHCGG